MAKEQAESKLKLIHIIWVLIVAIFGVGVTIGVMQNQQANNTKSIDKKVAKEVFEQHQQQQMKSLDRIYKGIEKLDTKLDDLKK